MVSNHKGIFMIARLAGIVFLALTLAGSVFGRNMYFFPHLANGPVGAGTYRTTFSLSNNMFGLADGSINNVYIAFSNSTGGMAPIPISSPEWPELSSTSGSLSFSMSKRETVTFRTGGSPSSLQVGWCIIQSDLPLLCSEDFAFFGSTGVIFTAGVLPAPEGSGFSMPVSLGAAEPSTGYATDMGLALAATGGAGTDIELTLFDHGSVQVGSTRTIHLPGWGYTAQFITGLFPEVPFGESFHGMLEIKSNMNVVAMALKGVNGVFSSLPVLPNASRAAHHLQEIEPNDVKESADDLSWSLPTIISGTLSLPTSFYDTDYFKVSLAGGRTIHIIPAMYARGLTGSNDWFVELTNSAGTVLVHHDSMSWTDPEPITYTIPALGAYYIVVSGYNGTGSSVRGDGNNDYELIVY